MANTVAYGFTGLTHLFGERVTTVGIETIRQAYIDTLGEYNRTLDGMLASLVERTTTVKERFYLPGDGSLQPLDEWGVPLPTRVGGYYDVAYPIQGGGDSWGGNRVSTALMTTEEANRFTIEVMRKDADWMRRHIMAALLDKDAWTYEDDLHGSLTIQPLANGDTVTYLRRGGTSSTDNHYLAQAAAIDDSNNPFDDIYDELSEHPANSGPYVAYVSTSLKSSIEGLAVLHEVRDPDIVPGTSSDYYPLTDEFDSLRGFGDAVIGKANNMLIVEWKSLPAGYMICQARGAGSVLRQREYPDGRLQGLFPEFHSPDGARMENRAIRYAGFGVRNRVAALAYYVGGASYVTPTAFDAPLKE